MEREIIGIVLNGLWRLRSLALMVSLASLGCHAQTPAPAAGAQVVQPGVKLSPELARRVEVMIRSRSQVSEDYVISIGEPSKSEVPGYDLIVVTFAASGNTSRPLSFLLSTDGKTLAQFNKFDLSKDPREMVSAAGRPARGGPPDAPVVIVGFDDLECPFCAKLNAEIFPALLDHYRNQVRVVYRDFPLEEIHPWAMHAAVDANCLAAGSTAGYWDYIDYVHAHAAEMAGADKTAVTADGTLDKIALDEAVRQKLDQASLAACVQKQDTSKIKASVRDAESDPLRIGSTPVLYVNGEKVEGVVPIETLYRIVDGALIAAGQTPPPAPPPAAPTPQTVKPGS